MDQATFHERFDIAVKKSGMTQSSVAEAMGVSLSGLKKWLTGDADPKLSNLLAFSKVTGVDIHWLVTGEGPMLRTGEPPATPTLSSAPPQPMLPMDELVLVPRHDVFASAGGGCFIGEESILDYYAFRRDWLAAMGLQKDKLALISVKGDSMEPTLKDGDLLLINRKDYKASGDAIYVLRVDDVLLAKRVQRMMDGSLIVKSDNPTYREQVIPPEQVEGVCIIGRVVWAGRKM